MNIPNVYALLIYLIEHNGGSFHGKTNIHKNIYLLQQMMPRIDLPLKFSPYFYGPFSQDVSEALDLLESSGLLKVSAIDYGVRDSFEVRKYIYKLTSSGRSAAESVKKNYNEFASVIDSNFAKLISTGYHENTKVISTASKVKHILSAEKKSLTRKSIQAKAKELGWEINTRDLSASVKVLVDIGLARTGDPSQK
ncbi:MAG: hypothetical protein V3V99_05165 [candidate division Zixibacteria bacterium]